MMQGIKMIRKNKKFIDPRYFMDEKLEEVTNMNRDLDKYKEWIDDVLVNIGVINGRHNYPERSLPQNRDEVVEQWEAQDVVGDTLYDVFLKGGRAGSAEIVAMDWFTE
tara:strand:- start:11012 stop:11335 length:324 start_codon:yes stop_codon:yes gene_type:complete